jgi:hypothetical protein
MMNNPLLGELTDVYNGLYAPKRLWQGRLQNPIFTELLLVQFEGTDEIFLTPDLEQSLNAFLEQADKHKQLALEALLEYYRTEILVLWRENDYFGVPELASQLVPNVQTISEFEALLTYPRLLLHESNSWGLEFECTWDVEHGTGVLFVDGAVVQTGMAEAAH